MKDISIILSCYNDETNIEKVLDSYVGSIDYILELFLIDDGSTDDSRKKMEKYLVRYKEITPLFFNENKGLQERVEDTLPRCTGTYFILGSSNDIIANNFLKRAYETFEKFRHVGFVTGNTTIDYKYKIDEIEIIDKNLLHDYCSPTTNKNTVYISANNLCLLLQKRLFFTVFGQSTLYKTKDICELGYDRRRFGFWHDNFYPWVLGLRNGFIYIQESFSVLLVDDSSWHVVERNKTTISRYKNTGVETLRFLLTFKDIFPLLNKSGILGRVSRYSFDIFFKPRLWNKTNFKNWSLDQKIVISTYLNIIKLYLKKA